MSCEWPRPKNPHADPCPHAGTDAANRRKLSGLRPLHQNTLHDDFRRRQPDRLKFAALNAGVDIVVATPGRLLDLMQQGFVDLAHVEVLVLDEADRMLDMGFINDLRRIVATVPKKRQTLLFSATLPAAIRQLAAQWLDHPVNVQVGPQSTTVATIRQSVFFVDKANKLRLLTHWLQKTAWQRTLVFTRTKHGADKVAKGLAKVGIEADAFHSNKSQSARQRVLLAIQVAASVGPGGHRHCGSRARHRPDFARGELRFADGRRELRASRRPHGPRRRRRRRRIVLRPFRAGHVAGHSAIDPSNDSHRVPAGRVGRHAVRAGKTVSQASAGRQTVPRPTIGFVIRLFDEATFLQQQVPSFQDPPSFRPRQQRQGEINARECSSKRIGEVCHCLAQAVSASRGDVERWAYCPISPWPALGTACSKQWHTSSHDGPSRAPTRDA